MALNAGDETAGVGTMARAIYDEMIALVDIPETEESREPIRRLCAAIARGVCAHVASNADVRITTTMSGLQRAGGTPTTAPSADVVLAGAIE